MFQTFPGWDEVQFAPLSASQTGVGTAYSAVLTMSEGVDIQDYGAANLENPFLSNYSIDPGMDGYVALEGRINGVFTELVRITLSSSAVPGTYSANNAVGSVLGNSDQLRVKTVVTAGAGTIMGEFSGPLYFLYGRRKERALAI